MSAAQYLTSDDAEVIAVIKANEAAWPVFRDTASAWAKERGFDRAMWSQFTGCLIGLPGVPAGFGRWTKPNHRGISFPFKNNTAEREVMAAIRLKRDPVPGLPSEVMSPGPDFSSWVMQSRPFVNAGRAWVGFSHPPEDGTKFGDQWAECLASQFFAAREAYLGRSS